MYSVVLGKRIKNNYTIENYKMVVNEDTSCEEPVFTGKPRLKRHAEILDWEQLCGFEGEPKYNINHCALIVSSKLNISADKEVTVEKQIFRADLNELHLYTNKVIEEDNSDYELMSFECDGLIRCFNEQMIKSNEALNAYCKLHKLEPGDTDCIELFKLVFPNEEYVIEDNAMKVVNKAVVKEIGVISCADDYRFVNNATISSATVLSTK